MSRAQQTTELSSIKSLLRLRGTTIQHLNPLKWPLSSCLQRSLVSVVACSE